MLDDLRDPLAPYEDRHFSPATKEVTFILGEREYTQRASLDTLMRIEGKLGACVTLIRRLGDQVLPLADLVELMRLILARHKDAPRGDDLVEAIGLTGVIPTMIACIRFLGFGLSTGMPLPPRPDAEGNVSPSPSPGSG